MARDNLINRIYCVSRQLACIGVAHHDFLNGQPDVGLGIHLSAWDRNSALRHDRLHVVPRIIQVLRKLSEVAVDGGGFS